MYKIVDNITKEEIVFSDEIRYVKKADNGCLVECSFLEGEKAVILQKLYDLNNILIEEIDEGEIVKKIKEKNKVLEVKNIDLEDAICILDKEHEERIVAIEDAICELDLASKEE